MMRPGQQPQPQGSSVNGSAPARTQLPPGISGEFLARISPGRFALLLACLIGLAVSLELGRMDVWDDIEAQRAGPPAEMYRDSEYVVPTLNGQPYLNKPPLLFWAIAALYAAADGPSEFLGRVPTALSGVLLGVCVYAGLRRRAGDLTARWTAMATASAPYVLLNARWANLDVPLTLAVFLTVMALYAALEAASRARALGCALAGGVSLGAASLLKGPPAYIFVIAAFLAWGITSRETPQLSLRAPARWTLAVFALAVALWLAGFAGISTPFPLALALFAAIWTITGIRAAGKELLRGLPFLLVVLALGIAVTAPWALLVLQRIGWEDIRVLLSDQVIERTHSATAINAGSPFYYLYMLPIILAPWGLLLPLHLSQRCWNEGDRFYRFSLLMGLLSVFAFCLIAGKENKYVLPAAPFLLMPVGRQFALYVEGNCETHWSAYLNWWRRLVQGILTVGAAGLVPWVFFGEFHPVLFTETAILACTAIGVLYLPWRRRAASPFTRVAVAVALVMTAGLLTRGFHYTGGRSPKELGVLCGRLIAQGYTVEATALKPPFAFYAARPIKEVQDMTHIRAGLDGPAPYFYLTREKLLEEYGAAEALRYAVYGPVTNKDYLLLGNRDPLTLLGGGDP